MHLLPVLLLLGIATAVDMKYYEAETGVADGFENFLETFIGVLENVNDATSYANYFAEDAQLKVLDPPVYEITGKDDIVALWTEAQQGLTWNHFPNVTRLESSTAETQTIEMNGKVESHWVEAGNCSTSYITWKLTLNTVDGSIDLTPQNDNIELFWDYVVYPFQPNDPTDIPCTG